MIKNDPTYNAFLKALQFVVERDWQGRKGALALEAGISGGYLSGILSEKKKAAFEKQNAIAEACGYPYEEFLEMGRDILDKEDTSSSNKKSNNINLTKETATKVVKVGDEMDQELKELLQHYREELKEMRQVLRDFKQENNYLRELNRELMEQVRRQNVTKPAQDEPQKKTAV